MAPNLIASKIKIAVNDSFVDATITPSLMRPNMAMKALLVTGKYSSHRSKSVFEFAQANAAVMLYKSSCYTKKGRLFGALFFDLHIDPFIMVIPF